jgi:hypothetical protein
MKKGRLILQPDTLICEMKKQQLTIPLREIEKAEMGTFSRIVKPIPLHYIRLHYSANGETRTLCFTPYTRAVATVWATNELVNHWLERLAQARGNATG